MGQLRVTLRKQRSDTTQTVSKSFHKLHFCPTLVEWILLLEASIRYDQPSGGFCGTTQGTPVTPLTHSKDALRRGRSMCLLVLSRCTR